MVSWYDHERERWRHKTGYTDATMSMALGQRLERASAARREGFTSSVREEAIAPIEGQLQQFLTQLRAKKRDVNYTAQLEQRIRRVLSDIGAKRLLDIDPGKVEAALLQMTTQRGFEGKGRPLSVASRNEYATSLMTFTTWAKKRRKIDFDPLESLEKADEQEADRVHPRRALSAEEIGRLLDATVERPAIELLTIRMGENKGTLGAAVRPSVVERARQVGRDRRMAYLLAIWTGLRRSELSQLEWRDVRLDAEVAYIQLRAEITKARRADVLPLHDQLAAELATFHPGAPAPSDRVVPDVPNMKVLKLDLAHARIDYGTKEIGFADLHSMRMTLNNLLAASKVGSRTRQAQLRHTDPKLTEVTYFDKSLYLQPHAEQLNQAAAIPSRFAAAKPTPRRNSGLVRAQNAHKTGDSEGHGESPAGTMTDVEAAGLAQSDDGDMAMFSAAFGIKRHGPASCDAGPCGKRAKGIEPSTFTLAT